METNKEKVYKEAVRTIARELRKASQQPAKEPDWEQRRYEIAKDLFPVLVRMHQDSMGIRSLSDISDLVSAAVDGADVLIYELKKPCNG